MARSVKKNSFVGIAAASDKVGKVLANRKLRRANKVRLADGADFLSLREVSNVWDFPKDGKTFVGGTVRK